MTPLRLGIVGAGSIVAKKHLLALAEVPEIAVAGLCRRDAGELQMLADRFRVPRRYTDYRDLLSDPGIDAVLVATGPAAQPEIVMAAAAAGKHVFAEKPMATTAAEARAVADALRHSPRVRPDRLQQAILFWLPNRVGVDVCWRARRAHRVPGSVLVPTRPGRPPAAQRHSLPRPRPILHGSRDEVFARTAEPLTSAATTAGTWAVSLRFDSGAVGNLLLSSLASWDYVNEHVDLVGSNHNALSVESGRVVRVFRRDDERHAQLCENTLSGHWWSGNEEQGFTGQFRVFARAVFRARARAAWVRRSAGLLAAGPEDGVRALELLEAVRESAAHGRSVTLPVHGPAGGRDECRLLAASRTPGRGARGERHSGSEDAS